MENILEDKYCKIVIVPSVFVWLATFFLEKRAIGDCYSYFQLSYICAKAILLCIIYYAFRFMYVVLMDKNSRERRVFLFYLPCLAMLFWRYRNMMQIELWGDELKIYNAVTNGNLFPYHFTYLTGMPYLLSLMLIPRQGGIVLIKILIQGLVCGYAVERSKNALVYVLFLLPVVMDYGENIHRMHYYALLYLVLAVKLVFDYKEHKQITLKDFLVVSLLCTICAIWRKEGIYLVVWAPFLICFAYRLSDKRQVAKTVIGFLLIMGLVAAPELDNYVKNRKFAGESLHTYNTVLVHMCRLGLDKGEYPEQMEAVDKILALDAIDYINAELGDANYEDEYIAWREGYIGRRDNNDPEDIAAYIDAVQYLILHEPVLFLKTRIGSLNYTSINGFVNFTYAQVTPRNMLLSASANIYIPLAAIMLGFLWSLFKKNGFYFFLTSGLLGHTLITVILTPAAYFKYYYHTYLIGWFFIFMMIGLLMKAIWTRIVVAR